MASFLEGSRSFLENLLARLSAGVTALTSTRIPYVGTDGGLTDDNDLLWTAASRRLSVDAAGASISGDSFGSLSLAAANTTVATCVTAELRPAGDNATALGNGSNRWSSIFLGGDISAGGGFRQWLGGGWVRTNVAAALTDSQLCRYSTAATQVRMTMPRAGSVTAISAWLNEAITAGGATAITIKVFLDGSVIASCELVIAQGAAKGSVAFAKDAFPFAANGELDIRITTDGSFAPTTTDLVVDLEVET